ncbi:MAG: S49 family peptidase [Alphaproteobacteria bacterium]|nr:S49 family peptidase [Alphaproteobacteria bacterium]
MGNWKEISEEIVALEVSRRQKESPIDKIRRKYIRKLHEETGRNVVVYYSGWLQKLDPVLFSHTIINDDDKNGFMSAFKGLDWNKGLDLVLHLPGGTVAATETIIDYIRGMFGSDIRTIVPQISMSGGTMLACAGKEIILGKHSNLGPIDPQFGSWPAFAVLEEFERASREVIENPDKALVWRAILEKYHPTLLSQAQHAIEWSKEIVINALKDGMLKDDLNADDKAKRIVNFLLSHDLHHAHGRHLHRKELRESGLVITHLEDEQELQDIVLSVHHALMHTLTNSSAIKIIENHEGTGLFRNVGNVNLERTPPIEQGKVSQISFLKRLRLALGIIFKVN